MRANALAEARTIISKRGNLHSHHNRLLLLTVCALVPLRMKQRTVNLLKVLLLV